MKGNAVIYKHTFNRGDRTTNLPRTPDQRVDSPKRRAENTAAESRYRRANVRPRARAVLIRSVRRRPGAAVTSDSVARRSADRGAGLVARLRSATGFCDAHFGIWENAMCSAVSASYSEEIGRFRYR